MYPYDADMAKPPSVDEALERARRAQEKRIEAIRAVAQARQRLADVREQTARELAELQEQIAQRIRQAEQEDVRAYNAAVTAGWTPAELKKLGFPEPEKKRRARRRSTRRTAPSPAAKDAPAPEPVTEPAPPSGTSALDSGMTNPRGEAPPGVRPAAAGISFAAESALRH